MKKHKKTIIILIVVAVAAWLLWKNGVFSKEGAEGKEGGSGTASAPGAENRASLNYILSNINFTAEERAKIESYRVACENSELRRQSVQADANAKGYSFDQMLVLKAIWSLYNPTNNAWIAGPDGTTSYGYNLQHKVLRLNGQGLW